MYDDEEYDDEINEKAYITLEIFKIIIIFIFLYIIYRLKDKNNIDDEEELNSKIYFELKNKTLNLTISNSSDVINITNTTNIIIDEVKNFINITNNIIDNTSNSENEILTNNFIEAAHKVNIIEIDNISNVNSDNSIVISKENEINNNSSSLIIPNITYFNITYINYEFSQKFNRTKLEYNIGLYDKNKNLVSPSELTLHFDSKFICFITLPELNITIYSIANNYENKYIKCIEYFNYGENITYGIKIYKNKYLSLNLSFENIINYNDLNHINDNLFDPDIINLYYNLALDEINKNNFTKAYYLKKEYFRTPNFDLRRDNISEDIKWKFDNFYNDYFCYCVGDNCFNKSVGKECKYLFYMTIIEKYKNLYPKTEYVFSDFIFNYLSSDDAYPIFQEMINQNYPAHYLTQNKNIIRRYCENIENCESIIYVDIPKYINYADCVEKYLTLILKTKAFITCRSTDYHKIGFLLYKTDYITYITVGHGVCYFKDYLFSDTRIYGPDMNDKVLIPPSEPLISIALKYGWKIENIIKINLPKWDKYDGINKIITENYIHNITNNSILVMFTYRMTRVAWNLNMSEYYFENITKLIFNERLQKELEENNLTLYFSLHRMVNPGYQRQYKEKLRQNKNINILPSSALSECLSKTNLVITDFSSILFDLMYRNKPFIIYLPDANDPLVDELYTPDYINLIHRMNNREWNIANICNNVEETVDKIIFYIKNKFAIDDELKKFFDYIGIKHDGSNIQKFIDYLIALK